MNLSWEVCRSCARKRYGEEDGTAAARGYWGPWTCVVFEVHKRGLQGWKNPPDGGRLRLSYSIPPLWCAYGMEHLACSDTTGSGGGG